MSQGSKLSLHRRKKDLFDREIIKKRGSAANWLRVWADRDEAGFSSSSLDRLRAGKKVNSDFFIRVFDDLGLNWEDYAVPLSSSGEPPESGALSVVGRDNELQVLEGFLKDTTRKKPVRVCIHGMGGVGKTELALEYIQRTESYYQRVCWFPARHHDVGMLIIRYVIRNFDIRPPDDLDLVNQVQWCWEKWPISKNADNPDVLVVFDDVVNYCDDTDEDASSGPIEPYLSRNPRFKVLMTTRNDFGDSIQKVMLDTLTPESSIQLLKLYVTNEKRFKGKQNDDAHALCEWLGYLPLGIELCAKYIRRNETQTFQALIKKLKEKANKFEALDSIALNKINAKEKTTHPHTGVKAAFQLTWEEELDDDEAARELGCLLSLFALADIPWELVETTQSDIGPEKVEKSKYKLIDHSLLKYSNVNLYRLHTLIREFLREQLEENKTTSGKLKEDVSAAIKNRAQEFPRKPTREDIASFTSFIPHVAEVVTYLHECLNHDDIQPTFLALINFYAGQGVYIQAIPWAKQYLAVTKNRFGNEHTEIVTSLSTLGWLYNDQGSYSKAELLLKEALAMCKQLLGDEHSDTAACLNNLAGVYKEKGRYREAESLLEEALTMTKKLLGKKHPDVAISLQNLAAIYIDHGRYSKAESLLEEALAIYKQPLDDVLLKITGLNNLAMLYHVQNRYDEAEPLYQEALAMYKKLLGDEHPDIALCLNNLASLYSNQERYSEAEPLYQEALAMYKKLLGDEHPDIALCLNNLASLYSNQERYSEAEPLLKEALAMWKQLLGDEHPNIASGLNNLAEIYRKQRRYSEAEPLLKAALAMQKRLLGDKHPDIAESLHRLANFYGNQRRYSEAESLYQEALAMQKRLLGNKHPDVAESLHGLANFYGNQGRYSEAEPLLREALAMKKELNIPVKLTIKDVPISVEITWSSEQSSQCRSQSKKTQNKKHRRSKKKGDSKGFG